MRAITVQCTMQGSKMAARIWKNLSTTSWSWEFRYSPNTFSDSRVAFARCVSLAGRLKIEQSYGHRQLRDETGDTRDKKNPKQH